MTRFGKIIPMLLCLCFLGISKSYPETKSQPDQQTQSRKTETKANPNPSIPPYPPVTQDLAKKDERKSHSVEDSEWWIAVLTGALVFVSVIQTGTFAWQGCLLGRTIKQMEKTEQRELRAYLSVVTNLAIYQVRNKKIQIKFEGKPRIINTGSTPAHNVKHRSRAGVHPVPLPKDFDFPLPKETSGGAVLGAQHWFDLSVVAPDFVPDQDVEKVKTCDGKALYVWGIVTYDDVFGNSRETKYCQSFAWFGKGKRQLTNGYYNERHNEST